MCESLAANIEHVWLCLPLVQDAKSRGKPRQQQLWTRLELSRGAPAKDATPGDDMRLVYARDDPLDQHLMFRVRVGGSVRHEAVVLTSTTNVG